VASLANILVDDTSGSSLEVCRLCFLYIS